MPAFLRQYCTEAACEGALQQARWPGGFTCPRCQERAHSTFVRGERRFWQCRACRTQTSLRAGTVFDHSKLPLTTWFLALYLLTQSKTNVAALELIRHLGICYRSAWRLKHKLMQAMSEREAGRRLGNLVQIDDAYLGGELPGGKPGRGSENKRPFVIAVETNDDGHPLYTAIDPIPGFSKAALGQWAQGWLRASCDVFSDGLSAFASVIDQGHAHTVIETAGGKAACEAPSARWVNVVLGNLKRALDGTYHAFKFFKYAQRYLAEAMWRFNRRFRMEALVPRLLVAAARCRPWSERRLRDVPVFGS